MGEIKDVLLKSFKDNPDVLKSKALLKMILKEIQDDPEYSGINH